METIFLEIGIIIFIATIVSLIMKLFKQPLIVGYILTGVVVGPYILNLTEAKDAIELFSKFGIAILLFIVGLNLRPNVMREVGKISIIAGLGQIIFTSVAGFFIVKLLGFNSHAALLGAAAAAFSSTIIVLKLITDKEDLNKLYAKISIGILIVQDIVAAIILLLLSFPESASLSNVGITQSVFVFFEKGILFFGLLYLASKFVLPRLVNFLARSQELLFLFSISWGIGLAALFYYFGFSLEIGALAAGVSLASSPFSQEVGARLKPLRDFFILLFFVMLGSQLVISSISGILLWALILSAFILVGKPLLVIVIMNLLGYRSRTSFFTGLAMAQISEFSLILVAMGQTLGYLSSQFVSLITLVGIITIAGSTYLFIYSEKIYILARPLVRFLRFKKPKMFLEEEEDGKKDLIIFGYDRVGYDFVNTAKRIGMSYGVVDFNPFAIEKLKEIGIPCFFGDADDMEFLTEIGVQKAKIVVSTIPDFKTNLNLVSFYRNHNKEGIVIAISHTIKDTQELYRHGASFVVMPHYLGAKHAAKMIENFGLKVEEFEKEKQQHLEDLENRLKLGKGK